MNQSDPILGVQMSLKIAHRSFMLIILIMIILGVSMTNLATTSQAQDAPTATPDRVPLRPATMNILPNIIPPNGFNGKLVYSYRNKAYVIDFASGEHREYSGGSYVVNIGPNAQTTTNQFLDRVRWLPSGSSFITGDTDIYEVEVVTGWLTEVTRGEYASISPDGLWMLYTPVNSRQLNLLDLSNQQLRVIKLDGGTYESDWHPNGESIVITQWFQGWVQIFNVRLECLLKEDCNTLIQLTNAGRGEDRNFNPRYSPDGSKIVFVRRVGMRNPDNVFIMNADGTNQQQLTNEIGLGFLEATWSPDGRYIIYNKDDALYIMNPDGSDQRVFIDIPMSSMDWWMSSEDIAASLAEATPAP
jgi:hypothetical protein